MVLRSFNFIRMCLSSMQLHIQLRVAQERLLRIHLASTEKASWSHDGEQGIAGSEKEQADEEMEIDLSNVCLLLSLIVHNCMIVMPFFLSDKEKKTTG